MSQHQAGFAGVPVKRLKQTELTWKVKDKATSPEYVLRKIHHSTFGRKNFQRPF